MTNLTSSQAAASANLPAARPSLSKAGAPARLSCALAGATVALTLLHGVSGGFIQAPGPAAVVVAAAASATAR